MEINQIPVEAPAVSENDLFEVEISNADGTFTSARVRFGAMDNSFGPSLKLAGADNSVQTNELPVEADEVGDSDYIPLDVQEGPVYETQKFKAGKFGKRGGLVFVDKIYGNDSTGLRERADRPFLTLTAAKLAAIPGDCIVVRPGEYDENNLLKSGVNWYFLPGAVVSYTQNSAQAIFDDSDGFSVSEIHGYGSFETLNASTSDVIKLSNNSALTLEGKSLSSQTGSAIRAVQGTVFVKADSIDASAASGSAAIVVQGTSLVNITCRAIFGNEGVVVTGGSSTVLITAESLETLGVSVSNSSGVVTVRSCNILSFSATGPVVSGIGGTTSIEGGTIDANASDWAVAHTNTTGRLFISNVRIDGQIRALALGSNGLIIQNIVIVTPSVNSIISAPGPSIVRNYGQSMSNKAVSGDITFATGTTHYEVDTDVVFV
jgi:hypothetical protein